MSGTRIQLVGAARIAAALGAGRPVRVVFVAAGEAPTSEEAAVLKDAERAGAAVRELAPRAFARLAADPSERRLIALEGPAPDAPLDEVMVGGGAVWLLVDAGYPGNAGFVIRTAEVSGAAAVAIDSDFDRIARRDAVRSSMRADRVLPVFFEPAAAVVAAARAAGRRVVVIEDRGARAPWEVDLTGDPLLVAGGEATGVPEALLDEADAVVRVPMAGFIPSYNLQAAVAAVAAERLRQIAGD